MSEETIRQYLQPKGKRTKEFLEEIDRAIVLEEARQRQTQADAPPWNVLFKTADEFNRVDRASRRANAEGLIEFCRETLLQRANAILDEEDRKSYPAGKTRALKVAENPTKKERE